MMLKIGGWIGGWARRIFDLDLLIIVGGLATTIYQMGHYLNRWDIMSLGYAQAAMIDLGIFRMAYWYRRFTGRRQKRVALTVLVLLLAASAAANFGFYWTQAQANPGLEALDWLRALPMIAQIVIMAVMAAVLPIVIGALSYMRGVKETSAFATDRAKPARQRKAAPQAPRLAPPALRRLVDDAPLALPDAILARYALAPLASNSALAEALGVNRATLVRRRRDVVARGDLVMRQPGHYDPTPAGWERLAALAKVHLVAPAPAVPAPDDTPETPVPEEAS